LALSASSVVERGGRDDAGVPGEVLHGDETSRRFETKVPP